MRSDGACATPVLLTCYLKPAKERGHQFRLSWQLSNVGKTADFQASSYLISCITYPYIYSWPPPPHPRPANADLLGSTAQGSMLLTNSPGDPYSQQLKNLWCQDWYNRKHFTLPWNAFPAYPLPFTTCLAYACSDRNVDLACNFKIHYFMLW